MKSKGLILKEYDTLDDYLDYEIKFSDNDHSAWLGQPHLISKFQNKFDVPESFFVGNISCTI